MTKNFWLDDEGEEIEQQDSFSSGGGDFDVIPAKTRLLADIEAITIESYKEAADIEYVNIQWRARKPELYENRIVFQKIKWEGNDPTQKGFKEEKQHEVIKKAKLMLAAIDKICTGGKVFALKRKPTEEDLQRFLVGKSATITVQVWNDQDKKPAGNWVNEVNPAGIVPEPKKPVSSGFDDMDDDIPFN